MKRIASFVRLRAISCICVILLHLCTSAAIVYRQIISDLSYALSMSVTYALFFAVPCFVMVTGALLLDPDKEIPLSRILKKYTLRILLALVISVLIFRIFTMAMNAEPFSIEGIFLWLKQVFTGESWSHLWYLYVLIGLYLLLPFYRIIAKHASDRLLIYLVAVYTIFMSILPLFSGAGYQSAFYIHVASIYPAYLFIGYMIFNEKIKISAGAGALLFLAGTAGTVAIAVIRYMYAIDALDVFLSYSSPFTLIQSVGIFTVFCRKGNSKEAGRLISSLDECSFAIYIFHMIAVRLIIRYWGFNPYEFGPLMFAALTIGILLATWIVVFLVRKIPGVSKVF